VGLPENLDWTKSRTLGLRLVRVLAQQVRANLEIRSQDGTVVRLVFTARSKAGQIDTQLRASSAP
jgi:two-component sensor histidine kinase